MLQDINFILYSWVRGGVFLLLLTNFVVYVKNREDVYKYFSLYLFGIFFYLFDGIITNRELLIVYNYVHFPLLAISFGFYLKFIQVLHNTKINYRAFHKASMKVSNQLFFIGVFILVIHLFLGYEALSKTLLYITPLYTAYVIIRLARAEIIINHGGIYSLIASWIFFILMIFTVLEDLSPNVLMFKLNVHPMFYFFIGVIIQILIYTFLIADTIQRAVVEKNTAEINLLKKTVQLYELKMTAFKNQINPHFLFNSLNSINSFVVLNKKEAASDYISKFSLLIRKVLQTTEMVFISLEEELEIAKLYIDIELVRAQNSFIYTINVDESINKKELNVVPLFLQPFIENAIWHGLSSHKGQKNLTINILDENEYVKAEIIDNGIGFKKSIYKKRSQKIKRKSFGIETIKNRLNLIYKSDNVSIKIAENLLQTKANGTIVSIVFPKKG